MNPIILVTTGQYQHQKYNFNIIYMESDFMVCDDEVQQNVHLSTFHAEKATYLFRILLLRNPDYLTRHGSIYTKNQRPLR